MSAFKRSPAQLAGCYLSLLVCACLGGLVPGHARSATGELQLDRMRPDIHDQASLQRGLGLYMDYCMGCHTLRHARYERTAVDLDIPLDIAAEYLLVGDQKIGDLMTNTMPEEAADWFGKVPPDLTLFARARGADYLYSYLRAFYEDPARPLGVNNWVLHNVGMPHAFLSLQGLNRCASKEVPEAPGTALSLPGCAQVETVVPGSMTAQEYDQAVYDLVNFLVYIAEPVAKVRYRMGAYVMLFLSVLLVFTWLLKREYWKHLH